MNRMQGPWTNAWAVLAIVGVAFGTIGLLNEIAFARSGGSACEGTATEASGPPHNHPASHDCGDECPPGIHGECLKRNIGSLTWPSGQVTAQNYICVCVEQATVTNPDGSTSTIEVDMHWDTLPVQGVELPVCDVFSFGLPASNMQCAGTCVGKKCRKDAQAADPVTGAPRYKCNCQ